MSDEQPRPARPTVAEVREVGQPPSVRGRRNCVKTAPVGLWRAPALCSHHHISSASTANCSTLSAVAPLKSSKCTARK